MQKLRPLLQLQQLLVSPVVTVVWLLVTTSGSGTRHPP
jgi:hypothetical protein